MARYLQGFSLTAGSPYPRQCGFCIPTQYLRAQPRIVFLARGFDEFAGSIAEALVKWRDKCSNADDGDRLRPRNIMIEHIATHPEAYHVWLVEDSEADELLMRSALKLDGLDCEFDVSPDGEKAIEFIEALDDGGTRPRPDIVLLDLNLPRKGGARVLERIRQSPKCSRVPVVVVTSSDSPGDKGQAARLGATRYFQKPLDLGEFMKLGPLVREVLNAGIPAARSVS